MVDDRDSLGTRGDEDDWFAAPGDDPYDAETIVWEDPEPPAPPPRRSPPLAGPWVAVGALVVAIALIVGGILVAQGLTDDEPVSSPTPPITTPDTTPETTPPTDDTNTPPATTPAPSTGDIDLPEGVKLRQGDSGPGVEAVQQALDRLGYETGAVDGDFGPTTRSAVVAFQTAEGLDPDGVVGPDTLNALAAALATG